MAVVKYNVEDVESGGGAEQPQPALYKGKIASATHRTKNARGEACNDIEVVVDVGEEFARLWTYIQLDNPATRWKLREFTDAMGLPPKGGFDPVKLKGKPVTVKVSADTDLDGNYRGKVKNLFMPGEAPGETDSNGTEPTDEEPLTEDELTEFTNDELKEELETRGLKISGRFSAVKAIAAILEDQGEVEAEEEPEDDDEPTGSSIEVDPALAEDLSTDEADYEEWTDDEVKQFMDDLGISGNLSGRKTRAKMVAHIVEFAEQVEGGGGEGGGEDAAPEDDYDEWPDKELLDEVNTRIEQGAELKISGRKTKEKMIAALRADDSNGEPF
jgi:hypothetical protein